MSDESRKLQELIERKKQLDQEIAKFTKLVTVMFTDIVGSTSYFEKFGDVAGLVYVSNCIDRLSPIAEKHGGTISKTIGDALMCYFDDPIRAIDAAIEMQRTLEAYNFDQIDWEKINVRIGLNYGPGMVKEKDVFGDAVNTAARIEALAKSQQILISCTDKTHDERFRKPWEEKVRSTFPIRETPDVQVKGKGEKLLVFEVLWQDMTGDHKIEVAPMAPQMAGRVNVEKAAEAPPDKGTVILDVSPMASVAAAKPKVAFSLMVVRPDGSKGQEYPLNRPAVTLGRVDGDILFPDDPLVSRRHARFLVESDSLKVEDMNSANGIFCRLNRPHKLQSGDVVLMGRQMFRFVSPRRDAAAAAAQPLNSDLATTIGAPAAGADAGSAELVRLLPGGVEEKHFALERGENTLGRTRGNLAFPEDAFLSSQHCKIVFRHPGYVLEDLQAANGTFVAIRERTSLNDGDILLVGHQLLRVTVVPA